jgi:hypothetical protein
MSRIFLYHTLAEGIPGIVIALGLRTSLPSIALQSAKTNQQQMNLMEVVSYLMLSSAIGPFYCYYFHEDSIPIAVGCLAYHFVLTLHGLVKYLNGTLNYGPDPAFIKPRAPLGAVVVHGLLFAGFVQYLLEVQGRMK